MKKAIILLSGGLDSTTLLAYAKARGFHPHGLIFDYGQRHRKEVFCAKRVAAHEGCPFRVLKIDLPWQGSSLLDQHMRLPRRARIDPDDIPSTYVPARNIIFLSFAASLAEAVDADAIFIGANAVDYSGYPDCRPDFFRAYQSVLAKGLKAGVHGRVIKIHTPLLRKTKAEIIRMGMKLNAAYHLTWSCYQGGARPCGRCDSCRLRARGFREAGQKDPLTTGGRSRKA